MSMRSQVYQWCSQAGTAIADAQAEVLTPSLSVDSETTLLNLLKLPQQSLLSKMLQFHQPLSSIQVSEQVRMFIEV